MKWIIKEGKSFPLKNEKCVLFEQSIKMFANVKMITLGRQNTT